MPIIVDGNNLAHALGYEGTDAGRLHVCELLAGIARRGEKITAVFDGPHSPPQITKQLREYPIQVCYSGLRSADELIINFIAADTAPKRLTIVSTDREIRDAARKRRCPTITSEQFADTLVRADKKTPKHPEPPEKRTGLTDGQTKDWMRRFGFDPD